MCGIFGITVSASSGASRLELKSAVQELFRLSESRGKEASGISILSGSTISIYKTALRASAMARTKEYRKFLSAAISGSLKGSAPLAIIGHSRLVTNGRQGVNSNNQPIIKDGIVGVHNGIIVNCDSLWQQYPALKRLYEVDSEIIFSLIRSFCQENISLVESVRRTFALIRGAASIAALFRDMHCVLLATNTGSLYLCKNHRKDIYIFASELHILKTLTRKRSLLKALGRHEIFHIKPGSGCLIDLQGLQCNEFLFRNEKNVDPVAHSVKIPIEISDVSPAAGERNAVSGMDITSHVSGGRADMTLPDDLASAVDSLKRCTRCVLPQTMPFIKFDSDGICNYCRDYRRIMPCGLDKLEELAQTHRSKDGRPDCIVGLSGGRDSTYGLHYIKTVLKMNPIAYTYDWGMVTDFARRNISRICGKLGVEHILISADVNTKRGHIRKNVSAWMNKPDLGIIPLFMAGDKQYFYYAHRIMKQADVRLIFLCENMLERTDFKTGFCGIAPERIDEDHVYTLFLTSKLKLFGYYAKQYLGNRAYLNSSIPDTLWAYFCYYLMPRNYINLYRYINWDEQEIVSTLMENYDWESADDTSSTWRIGDGTASFYNYIYYALAGFTENDTFRSNQIREGIITRMHALELVRKENKPRYDSMKRYCDTIGIDFNKTMLAINSMPKLYKFTGT